MVTIAKPIALRTANAAVSTGLRPTQKRRALGAGVHVRTLYECVRGFVLLGATQGGAAERKKYALKASRSTASGRVYREP